MLTNLAIRIPLTMGPGGGGAAALLRSTMIGVTVYFPPAMVVYGVIVALGHAGLARGARPDARGGAGPAAPSPSAYLGGPPPKNEFTSDPATDPHHFLANGRTFAPADAAAPSVTTAAEPDRAEREGAEHEGADPEQTDAERASPEPADRTPAAPDVDHLAVRQWNRVHLVRVAEIDWIEAQDNYVVVHAAGQSYKGRERLADVEARLDARRFVRVHRSTIVHVPRIREVQPLTHGDHAVILRDGKVLRVARSRRPALEAALGMEL